MTRINVVPVQELCNKHLFAEWRELPRINKYIKKSLNSKKTIEIPPEYVLGTGHVKFFYNKLGYIVSRYEELTKELLKRNYNIETRPLVLDFMTNQYWNDWAPSDKDMELNRQRIKDRMPKNPKWSLNEKT
jgi:deoxyribonuclease (pyrimidine dimer)